MMSDIIPFPKRREKIEHDIDTYFEQEQFEKVYDLFIEYEKHYELTPSLAIKKCQTLWEVQAYLELKEETNILMIQGYQPYDTLMIFYVKSLFQLQQYRAVVDVIEQVIDEVKEHQTRLIFLPIKDEANAKLNQRHDFMQHQLQKFVQLSTQEQAKLILDLIDDQAYQFTETLAFYLNYEALNYRIITLILEYLTFARYNQTVRIEKFENEIEVNPSSLSGFSHTDFKNTLMPRVVDKLEKDMPSLVKEAYVHLNTHNIALYPIELSTIASIEDWIEGYHIYFKSLIGEPIDSEQNYSEVVDFIKMLNT